jgi:hypothetical protein
MFKTRLESGLGAQVDNNVNPPLFARTPIRRRTRPRSRLISTLAPCRLKVYDPVVPAFAADHPRAQGAPSALAAAEGVDALAIMTPWPAFRELKPADLARVMAGRTLLDPYRLLDGGAVAAAGLDYLTLGAPPRRAKEYRCV